MISHAGMDEEPTGCSFQSRERPSGFMAHYFLSVLIEEVRAKGIVSRPVYL